MIGGLSGLKGSGKTKAAEYLIEKYKFQKVSFAEPLKRGVQILFGIQDDELFGNDVQKTSINTFLGVSPRQILQYLGTDIFRNNPIFAKCHVTQKSPWIAKAQETIEKMPKNTNVIIDDVRFPDELDFIPHKNTALIQRNIQNISQEYNKEPSLPLLPCPENPIQKALEAMVPYYTQLDEKVQEEMQNELFHIMDVQIPTFFKSSLCWLPFQYTQFLQRRHTLQNFQNEIVAASATNSHASEIISTNSHASETQVLNIAKIIENNGTLDDLYHQLDIWMQEIQ